MMMMMLDLQTFAKRKKINELNYKNLLKVYKVCKIKKSLTSKKNWSFTCIYVIRILFFLKKQSQFIKNLKF